MPNQWMNLLLLLWMKTMFLPLSTRRLVSDHEYFTSSGDHPTSYRVKDKAGKNLQERMIHGSFL